MSIETRSSHGSAHRRTEAAPAVNGASAYTNGAVSAGAPAGRRARRADAPAEFTPILIIGTGFAGLGMGVHLKKAGIDGFVLLERAEEIGGTWRDNHYPGCACDVPSHLYSFSFELNPDWQRMFAAQAEIQNYLKHCASKYRLLSHVRFGQNVLRAEYDEADAHWTVYTESGKKYRTRVLISAMGALSNPAYPAFPGVERFQGHQFHSAEWDHTYDLTSKRVAVIGTGASAIQFVPQIAPRVARLDLYQRTPPWIMPKADRPVRRFEKSLFRRLPSSQKLVRSIIYWALEARVLGFNAVPQVMKLIERAAHSHLERQISDPELRRKLTPSYRIGCKRVLISDDYYPALNRANVDVVTSGIREITNDSIITQDGHARPVDAIIYSTGFQTQKLIGPGMIIGRRGLDLTDAWRDGMQAYKGTTVSGFPNFFFIVGPNTGLGHNSMIYMIESQIAYILDAIRQIRARGWSPADVKAEAQSAYNERLQTALVDSVWQSGCRSWYLDANGKNTTIWPSFTFRFRWQTKKFDGSAYEILQCVPRTEASQPSSARPSL